MAKTLPIRTPRPADTPYTFRIPLRDLKAIRAKAKQADRTIGSVLREAARDWIERRTA